MTEALSAFHGRVEVRNAALARLATHIEAGRLVNGPLVWNTERGSVVGCLTESADIQQWVDQLGLPKWLAHALDAAMADTMRDKVLARTAALFGALPLGADLGPAGSRMVCALLEEASSAVDEPDQPQELGEALRAVEALHARCVQGDAPAATEWRSARKRAVAVTDALRTPRQQGLGGCVEAAAWSPQTSPSVVSDLLRQWKKLQSLNAEAAFGWTQADDEQIRRLLGALHAEHLAGRPGEKRTVFDLLELHHAEIATRLRAQIQFVKAYHADCAERAADMLIRLVAANEASPA